MQIFTKAYKPPRWLFAAATAMLLAGSARAQKGIDVSNTTNYGSASWGVGTGINAFTVDGPYNAVADSGTDYFYDAGSNMEIAGTTAPAFYNLTVDNGAARTTAIRNSAGIDVTNNLTLLNGITTTPNTVAGAIRMGSGATTSGSGTFGNTRYVDGYMAKAGNSAFTYPVGAGGYYAPVILSNPAGTTLRYTRGDQGSTTLKSVTQGTDNLATVSVTEYYPISAGNSPAGASLSLTYAAGSKSGIITVPAALTIAGFNGTNWVNLSTGPATVNTGTGTVTVTLNQALSGITAFTLGSTLAANPLPVTLRNFTAEKTAAAKASVLRWITDNEQGIASYKVERSRDAQTFTSIVAVTAKDAPGGEGEYVIYDRMPLEARNYYRIAITGKDGAVTYSSTLMLNFADKTDNVVRFYPNPAQSIIYIESAAAGNGKARMFSVASGAMITEALLSEDVATSIDVIGYPAGTYFIQVSNEEGKVIANEKITVMH